MKCYKLKGRQVQPTDFQHLTLTKEHLEFGLSLH
jgi:hypothetical protein